MYELLLILFVATLFLYAIANRMRGYVKILIAQGIILFALSIIELGEIRLGNVIWIATETLLFKSFAVPAFMFHIINRNNITHEAEPYLSHFTSLIITILIVTVVFIGAGYIGDISLDRMSFVSAISAILFGLWFICSRRKLLSQMIGYMIIENGVFILTAAVGNEMPFMINLAVLLDIFASLLILGFFAGRIGDVFKDNNIDSLTTLKD